MNQQNSTLSETEYAVLSRTAHQLDAILTDLDKVGFTPSDNYGHGNERHSQATREWLLENPTLDGLRQKVEQLDNAIYSNVDRLFRRQQKIERNARLMGAVADTY